MSKFLECSKKTADSNSSKSDWTCDWLQDNIAKPAYNAGFGQPLNTLANIVNTVCSSKIIGKLDLYATPPPKTIQAEIAQSISSGLVGVVPYIIAGKTMGLLLGAGSRAISLEGVAAKALNSQTFGLVAGAAVLDGFRDLQHGETVAGNVLGGATAFAAFGIGNPYARYYHAQGTTGVHEAGA